MPSSPKAAPASTNAPADNPKAHGRRAFVRRRRPTCRDLRDEPSGDP
ncbi:hypothetical protein ACQP2T_18460 [Nonomuraea sp. CA-143628]